MADQLRTIFMDGIKSIELPQYPDSAWQFLTGEDANTQKLAIADYFSVIPWLSRGVALRSSAVSAMPFCIYQGDEEIASYPDNWDEEMFPFFPSPGKLLWLVEASLVLTGAAYLAAPTTVLENLRYLLPSSVTPVMDQVHGLTGWKRQVGSMTKPVKLEEIIYWWYPDPFVELGPATSFPARAAVQAAGVLYNVDAFAANFFKRGAIKATLLTVAGNTPKADRNALESWWASFVGGLSNAWSTKVINADMVKAVPIGEGIESLQNQSLSREKREDIATALGIPQTMLFSDASTNATAAEDTLHFLQRTIVPDCSFIATEFNQQFWSDRGYEMVFQPDELEAFQEDEAKRSAALKNLTDAGLALDVALDVLGYDLDEDQELRVREEMDKPKPQPTIMFGGGGAPGGAPKPEQEKPVGTNLGPNPKSLAEELRAWEKFEVRRLGKSKTREFECKHIGKTDADRIRRMAAACDNEQELHILFEGEQVRLSPDIRDLARAIEQATRALAEQEEDELKSSDLLALLLAATKSNSGSGLTIQAEGGMTVNQEVRPPNVQVDVHVPDAAPPEVRVNVASPVVHVAAPEVKQTIVTPGPERVVRSTEKQKVIRNAMGDMTNTESETTYEYGGAK